MTHQLFVTVECDKCGDEIDIIIPDIVNPEEYTQEFLRNKGWKIKAYDICPDCIAKGEA